MTYRTRPPLVTLYSHCSAHPIRRVVGERSLGRRASGSRLDLHGPEVSRCLLKRMRVSGSVCFDPRGGLPSGDDRARIGINVKLGGVRERGGILRAGGVAHITYETYAGAMGSHAARKADDAPDALSARRARHLRLVTPDEFAMAAAKAAQDAGQPSDILLGFLAGALAASLPDDADSTLRAEGDEADPAEVRQLLFVGELLQSRIRQFMTDLRAAVPIEAPSSEVRKNWAEYLERVRVREETVYVTQHGKRVAALVPPYVAESYANDQAWFHTREWQEKEAQADADFAEGRAIRHESDESFLEALSDGIEDE